jgi:hypothetical protein
MRRMAKQETANEKLVRDLKVSPVVMIYIVVFYDEIPCSLVRGYEHFGRTLLLLE